MNEKNEMLDNAIQGLEQSSNVYSKLGKITKLMPLIKAKSELVKNDPSSYDSITYCDGFLDGYESRINSVWHDIEESPKQGSLIAVFDGNDMHLWRAEDIENVIDGRIRVISITVKECFERQHIIKWAYIEDLLPTKED